MEYFQLPYNPRRPFVDFHNRKHRWSVMVCHRRAGKTVACISELVLRALFTSKKDARFAYVAPAYNQAKDIAWQYLIEYTKDILGVEYNISELRCDLPNGSRIRLYGASNADRMRGLYFDGVILDEFGDMPPSVWTSVIRPLLTDRKGWAVFIGTPKGKNQFYEIYQQSLLANDRWHTLLLKSSESGLIDRDELLQAKIEMPEEEYNREFECSFDASITGAYYAKEMLDLSNNNQITNVEYDSLFPVYTAWDMGWTDTTSIWYYQLILGEIRVIEYNEDNGKSISHYCSLLKSKPYRYATHWLPHDARAKTLASGGKSVIEQMGVELDINKLKIVPSLSLQDGIQATRMMLPKCYIDKDKCSDGIEALRQYRRVWDEKRKIWSDSPLHDWSSHPADAFRMLAISVKFDKKAETKPKEVIIKPYLTYNDYFNSPKVVKREWV